MKNFFRSWSELISLPIAIMLWILSPELIRWMDPTAGTYDAGIFQIVLFAVIELYVFTCLVWLYMRITWPSGYKILDQFIFTSEELTSWQKSKLAFGLFAVLLLSLVLLSRAI